MPFRILQVPEHGVLDAYQARLTAHGFSADAAQRAAVERLQRLYGELLSFKAARRSSWRKMVSRAAPPRGVYFWGGVGRGKSFLMDCFFDAVPYRRKRRVHFHAFMREIHARLNTHKGGNDPLAKVADQIADELRLLCFDEFHVSDIADAMILGRLLEALFARGVVIVMTSNYPPKRLYPDGLQRENFLPTIALIERQLDVIEVDAGVDYRQRTLERVETFRVPADAAAERQLAETFAELAAHTADPGEAVTGIEIIGRQIPVRRLADDVVWFDFSVLCGGPRSQNDYLDIARRFSTVLLSGIPQMDARHSAEARRFTWLVDVFYDHRVKLIASAACEPDQLYRDGVNSSEFFRTASRLAEMRSREYLALPHID